MNLGNFLTNLVGNPLGNMAFTTPNSTIGQASMIAGAPYLGGAPTGGGMDFMDVPDAGGYFGGSGGSPAAGGSGFNLGNLFNLGKDAYGAYNQFQNFNKPAQNFNFGNLPYGDLTKSILGMIGQNSVQGTLQGMFNQVLNADPWNNQMSRYQQPLYDAATKGIGDTAYGQSVADAAARKMASMGYNGSGNQAIGIAQALNSATPQYMSALSPLAMGRQPQTTGAGLLGMGMGEAQQGMYSALGHGLEAVIKNMGGGNAGTGPTSGAQGNGLGGLFNGVGNVVSDIGHVFGF